MGEVTVVRRDGRKAPAEVNCSALGDGRVLVIARDIT
jgi:hypothetical protein